MNCSLPLIVLLVVNSNSYLSACQSVRGVFFFPYTSQYVGVIFNHNTVHCVMFSLTWFDDCSFLFLYTYFNNDSI